MIEVEEKFTTPVDIEEKLLQNGFSLASEIEMTDWYFDGRCFELLQQDTWLRCREGQWQLKVGQNEGKSRSVAYSEHVGQDALQIVNKLLQKSSSKPISPEQMEPLAGPEIPLVPPEIDLDLVPFARIFTRRSSWKRSEDDLSVDLDTTDFGYGLGEVELLVKEKEEIPAAQQRLKEVLQQLTQYDESGEKTMGKLEYYLSQKRPDVFQFCVEKGLL